MNFIVHRRRIEYLWTIFSLWACLSAGAGVYCVSYLVPIGRARIDCLWIQFKLPFHLQLACAYNQCTDKLDVSLSAVGRLRHEHAQPQTKCKTLSNSDSRSQFRSVFFLFFVGICSYNGWKITNATLTKSTALSSRLTIWQTDAPYHQFSCGMKSTDNVEFKFECAV